MANRGAASLDILTQISPYTTPEVQDRLAKAFMDQFGVQWYENRDPYSSEKGPLGPYNIER